LKKNDGAKPGGTAWGPWIFLALFLLPGNGFLFAGPIRFDHINTRDGLSQSSISSIIQDRFGFMWFGTQDGLNRYDGYEFRVFKYDHADTTSLSDNWASALLEDRAGNLWVGTYGSGLNRLNPDGVTFTRYTLPIEDEFLGWGQNKVQTIMEDQNGLLWVGTETTGIVVLEGDKKTRIIHEAGRGDSLSSNEVRDIFEDSRGNIWIATGNGLDLHKNGLAGFQHFRYDPNDPQSLSSSNCSTIFEDKQGFLWIGTLDAGLNRFNPETFQSTRLLHNPMDSKTLSSNMINDLLEDPDGNIWIATDNGLNRYHPQTGELERHQHDPNDLSSLAHRTANVLYQDNAGVLWVGSYGAGLSKFNRQIQGFQFFKESPRADNGFKGEFIFSLFQDKNEDIWLGSWESGITHINHETGKFSNYQNEPDNPNSLSHNRVYCVRQDSRDNFWIATFEGLNKFTPETRTFQRYLYNPNDPASLQANQVVHIFEDKAGRLWVGTYGAGLGLMDRDQDTFKHYTFTPNNPNSINNNFVNYIYEGMDERFWIATELGLAEMDREKGSFTRYHNDPNNPNSLSHESLMCLYQNEPGSLWIGTFGGGLCRLDLNTQQFSFVQKKDGLPNNSIYGILSDEQGYLWLSTNKGLCRYHPERNEFKIFDSSNALYSNEFNRGAFFKLKNGEMLFGGEGFYRFTPSAIKGNEYIPPVVLTSFRKFNVEVAMDKALPELESVELNYDENVISFGFAAMDFTSPGKNRFRYMLTGFNEEWIELGERPNAFFTGLEPGSYTLKVMGSNGDGLWNETPLELPIRIFPPWWKSWWAMMSYAVLIMIAVYSFVIYRHRQKKREMLRAISVGKARFASTVLHNIGNVLNSLRVACDQGRTNVKDSRLKQLVKAHKMMQANMDNLGHYLTEDPKGRLLPGYFISVGEVLVDERESQLREFEEMNRKIILMRDIIENQQAQAKKDLIQETHDLNEILEEALQVFQNTLDNNGIVVEKKLLSLPPIKAHKSQLMHIIINLAKNAVEAMEQNPKDQRILEFQTGILKDDRAFLKVIDMGVGIPEKNMEGMFSYGFTTKSEGHGFGLHSCVRAMRDMGGNIRVFSEGEGKGATFSLSFSLAEDPEMEHFLMKEDS